MRRLIAIPLAALMLAALPIIAPALTAALAQDATDAATDAQGNFSRDIPKGLKSNLSEAEIDAYQKRLDAAQTPQERNAVHRELQRTNQERQQIHEPKVKPKKPEKPEKEAKRPKAPDDATKRKLNAPAIPNMGGGGKKK